jgi:hypothetical protein
VIEWKLFERAVAMIDEGGTALQGWDVGSAEAMDGDAEMCTVACAD